MKLFKRVASAMLVGAMSLAMLTACGGVGGGAVSIGTQFENAITKAVEMQNDTELRAKALGMLDKIDPETGAIAEADAKLQDSDAPLAGGVITTKDVADVPETQADDGEENEPAEDEKLTAQAISTDTIGTVVNALKSDEVSFSRIGVATKVINGKTYAAVIIDTTKQAADTDNGTTTPDDKDTTGDTDGKGDGNEGGQTGTGDTGSKDDGNTAGGTGSDDGQNAEGGEE